MSADQIIGLMLILGAYFLLLFNAFFASKNIDKTNKKSETPQKKKQ